MIFNDKLNYSSHCEAIAKGAGRALGSIISKIHILKDFGFRSYEKLYKNCVVPILDYSASVWGFKNYQQIDNVQNRAIRYFLGLHRFAPTTAIIGDTGCSQVCTEDGSVCFRYWNRLVSTFPDNRIDNMYLTMSMDYVTTIGVATSNQS